jgi:predicted ATPase
MRGVVLTGGPGAGKTTLLEELGAMGYAIVPESARAIIAERLAATPGRAAVSQGSNGRRNGVTAAEEYAFEN